MPYNETTKALLQTWVSNDYPRIKAQLEAEDYSTIKADIDRVKYIMECVLRVAGSVVVPPE